MKDLLALVDAFQESVVRARDVWIAENSAEEGQVTPFDPFLYKDLRKEVSKRLSVFLSPVRSWRTRRQKALETATRKGKDSGLITVLMQRYEEADHLLTTLESMLPAEEVKRYGSN